MKHGALTCTSLSAAGQLLHAHGKSLAPLVTVLVCSMNPLSRHQLTELFDRMGCICSSCLPPK